jgi:4-amino-4-deoxy-L-arabinose transferase-like glycosyltransferase
MHPVRATLRLRLRAAWPLLALALLAVLGCQRGLWTPDEPREAEISREMALAPGMIPTLDGHRFIEKPPLYYWVVAGVFRATGGASVAAARAVSVMAGLATLALLYAWAAAAHSRGAALASTFMLATSVQFLSSSHMVLLDPLLMLSTTLAAWAGWWLLAGPNDAPGLRWTLFLALVVALWIKGLIGPVLIGAGLLCYLAVDRPRHWRRLRPVLGSAILLGAVVLLGLAIYDQGGRDALWQWAYVNHVERLVNPSTTGHRQPLLYYAWTLPFTLLPWLPAVWQALRPAHAGTPRAGAARYGAIMGAAMVLLLSVSATKRSTYLLPVLPLLFLWLGIRSYEWWQGWQRASAPRLGVTWWVQTALLCLYVLLAPVAAWVWTGTLSALIAVGLAIDLLAVGALLYSSARGARRPAGICALAAALVGCAVLLTLAALLLNATKDQRPFMLALGQRLPPGEPVYALHVDETLEAEVPFYTGRSVLALDSPTHRSLPEWVLVQDNRDGNNVSLPPAYIRVMHQSFGSGRSLTLWQAASTLPH